MQRGAWEPKTGPLVNSQGYSFTNANRLQRSCIHLGNYTNETIRCQSCKGHVELKLLECELYKRCTLAKQVPGVACCTTCSEYKTKPLVQVVSPSTGIGDNLLVLTIAAGYKKQFPEVEVAFVCNNWLHPWLTLFGGYDYLVTSNQLKGPTIHCDHSGDWLAFTTKGVPRWQFWSEKYGITPTTPSIKPLPTSIKDFAIPYTKCIVLSPFAAHSNRTWPLSNWLELERKLIATGFKVVVLDDRLNRANSFTTKNKLLQRSPAEVTSVIRNSLYVIGNDSGMCHVAGASSIPSIAICSQSSDKNIMGIWPTVVQLGGKDKGGLSAVKPSNVIECLMEHIGTTHL